MGFISRNAELSAFSSASSVDALHQAKEERAVGLPKTKGVKEKLYSDSIDLNRSTSPSLDRGKRPLPADMKSPEPASKKRSMKQIDDSIAHEAFERINRSVRCKSELEAAKNSGVPELFIDSKEKGLRVANLARDVMNASNRDRSLVASGQAPQGPTAWGRVFLYLPWAQLLEVLDSFEDIQKSAHDFHLVFGMSKISSIKEKQRSPLSCPFSAPARLDLMLRFGLLGCQIDEVNAQKVKSLIPEDRLVEAYSFALQNAVGYNNLSIVKYCLESGGKSISPDEGIYDYREASPIELVFSEGSIEIQELLLKSLDKKSDIAQLKELFMGQDRWEEPPEAIVKFIGES